MPYAPTPESIAQHPVPDWFHDAKLGIFVHWGLYSVPAWAPNSGELGEIIASGEWARWFANNPYAEWYSNTLRIPESPTRQHHDETYGPDFAYSDFAPLFNQATQQWNPDEWAALFAQVGARYVVLTTKHHDGFLLWPSAHPNPFLPGHQAERDLVGELSDAVREQGMTMALYYSGGLDWTFNDTVIRDIAALRACVPQTDDYIDYTNAHWRELIERYRPAILWNDIAYPKATDLNQLFADYYNAVPEGLVNNRFTQEFRMDETGIVSDVHADFETPEYTTYKDIRPRKWEACRGVGASFGYNQMEGVEQYLSVAELVRSFVDIVSKNGNLLLNVGPMADGTIPEMQRERLLGLGVNGEAIFGSRPWQRAEGQTDGGLPLRFTSKEGSLYAILMETPGAGPLVIEGVHPEAGSAIHLLGHEESLFWQSSDRGVRVELPPLPDSPAHTLRLHPIPEA